MREKTKTIQEAFPKIKRLRIHFQFIDPNNMGRPKNEEHIYTETSICNFNFLCPYVKGGCISEEINIEHLVKKMYNNREEKSKTSIYCKGRQDVRRINKNKCLLERVMTIEIIYK